jgi:3-deoxy-manno-octulosonate cytidylyltransferase (CMP-KDO synthetase)
MTKNIILIPARIRSKRLKRKALLKIENIPIIVHTYFRASLSKLADEVYVCTDSPEIITQLKIFKIPFIKTASHHKNGTERINEAAKKLNLSNNDIIIDVQGDEPLINPKNIDNTINFFRNKKFEIAVPNIVVSQKLNNESLVKILSNSDGRILWMSRSQIPCFYKKKFSFYQKHLSVIIFTKRSLQRYCSFKMSKYEKIESIELLRAIENNMILGTLSLNGESFSIDTIKDYKKALLFFKKDSIKYKYLPKLKNIC